MSEKELQTIIDKAVEASKQSHKKDYSKKIIIGVSISVISVAIITFFSSFYGVKGAVKDIDSDVLHFKNETKEKITNIEEKITNIEESNKKLTEFKSSTIGRLDRMEKDITFNYNTNFTQWGKINYLEGKTDRGINNKKN